MSSGFFGIGLHRPKFYSNVGSTLRAAFCYNANFVSISGIEKDAIKHGTNTPKAHQSIPVHMVDDLLQIRPFDTQIVCVDLVDDAVSLPNFKHPDRAVYIFGPEDGTLGKQYLDRCQHKIYIPTRWCMNLAATVNVVLYDRASKRNEWPEYQKDVFDVNEDELKFRRGRFR